MRVCGESGDVRGETIDSWKERPDKDWFFLLAGSSNKESNRHPLLAFFASLALLSFASESTIW